MILNDVQEEALLHLLEQGEDSYDTLDVLMLEPDEQEVIWSLLTTLKIRQVVSSISRRGVT